MTGLDLLRAIKSKGSKIPVVFVTASNDTDISMKALKAGACDYFVRRFKYYDQLKGNVPSKTLIIRPNGQAERPSRSVGDIYGPRGTGMAENQPSSKILYRLCMAPWC